MSGSSLITMEAIRGRRFPKISRGEQRNPAVPSDVDPGQFVPRDFGFWAHRAAGLR